MYIRGNSFQYYTYEVIGKFRFYKIKFKSLARFGGNFMSTKAVLFAKCTTGEIVFSIVLTKLYRFLVFVQEQCQLWFSFIWYVNLYNLTQIVDVLHESIWHENCKSQ